MIRKILIFTVLAVAELTLENEDTDRGTTFLNYTQTAGRLKVFEGQVQIVVNKHGEVLNCVPRIRTRHLKPANWQRQYRLERYPVRRNG